MTELLQDAISFDRLTDDLEGLPDSLELQLCIEDPEVIQALVERSGRERRQFALDALRIGVLALRHAGQRLDGDTIQRESSRLVEKLQNALEQHATVSHERMNGALSTYFDPTNGHFTERVRRLVGNDGELCQLLKAQLDGENSHLARTLLAHVGSESPLMKILDPAQSQGLLSALRETVDGQLTKQRDHVLREFSLDNKEGALCRLVAQLTANHGDLSKELQTKIDAVTKEFSLDEENSALSRLVRNVDRAQRAIHDNLTLDDDNSSLSRLKKELHEVLSKSDERNSAFQEEVKVTLARMITRREESLRSTRHGNEFEDAVCEFLAREAQPAGDVVLPTGNEVGRIKNCKVGDCVIELSANCAAPGAKIVVEAKEKECYSLGQARDEIETARKNRDASWGMFVFSRRTAPAGMTPFQQSGNDIFVIWDPEDPYTDVFLKAGILVARTLCVCTARGKETQAADFDAIDRAILDIEKRASNMETISKAAESIKSSSENILSRVRIDREALERQLAVLREKLGDLREITTV
ncbi:MAG: hypothetical protein WD851_25005 [Pirellulales bacterium]